MIRNARKNPLAIVNFLLAGEKILILTLIVDNQHIATQPK
jgi:hypothetical protein